MFQDKRVQSGRTRLFSAKTRVPQPPPNLLRRSRLLVSLRRATARKLALVLAPAGYGKTTVAAELAREFGHDAAWLTLDASDVDVSVFATYLVQAIARVRPNFGSGALAWLRETPNPTQQIEELAAILISEIEETAGERLVIFLDDFHEVVGSERIGKLLDLMFRYLPPAVHFLISTRLPPQLTMTRLVIQQQVLGMGMDDLRFSLDETASWLAEEVGEDTREQAERLVAATEGWAAGMVLHQAAEGSNPALGAGTVGVYDYLSREVLEQEPPEVQQFLLRAAVLNHLDAAISQEVLGVANADDLLQTVHDRQLFLAAIGGQRQRQYRMHQLFRDFLTDRFKASDPEEYTRLQRRAAEYFEAQGERGQAMQHLIASQDWAAVAELALRAGYDEIQAGRLERVEGWIAVIPAGAKERYPALLLIESRLLAAQSEISRAEDMLAEAERRLVQAGDERHYAEALVLMARLAAGAGNSRRVIDLSERALNMPAAAPATLAHAAHLAGIGYAMAGDAEHADTHFMSALSGFERLGDTASALNVSGDWGYALLIRDDLNGAVTRLQQALEMARQANNVRQQTLVLTNMALVHQMRADLEAAERYLEKAHELAHQAHWRRTEAEILLNQAHNAIAGEKIDEALRLYRESAAAAQGTSPAVRVTALAGQARCLRYNGRYADARRAARQGIEEAPPGTMQFEVALCKLELGGTLLDESPDTALELLRDADAALRGLGRKREAARGGALLATALFGALELAEAGTTLAAAWTVAVETGTISQILPELASVHGLALLRYVNRSDSRYAQLLNRLVEYLQQTNPEPPADGKGDLEVVRRRPHLIEVYSIGQAQVYRNGVPVARSEWQSASAKEMFFYLIEHTNGDRREAIQVAIWPDSSPTKARNNFHISLNRLRGALGADILRVDAAIYRVNPDFAIWHDGSAIAALIDRATGNADPETARRDWAAAAELLDVGAYAEEFHRDWAAALRHYWEEQTKATLGWLTGDAISRGAYHEAIPWGRRLVAVDPLDENGHLLMMRVYAELRQPVLLKQQYTELTRQMEYELNSTPSREARAQYQQLLRLAESSSEYESLS